MTDTHFTLCFKDHVKRNYSRLTIDEGWRFTEPLKSEYNLSVTATVVQKVKDTGLGFQEAHILSKNFFTLYCNSFLC